MLFDDFQRTDGTPRQHGEGLYDFLNRAAGPYWQGVRDLLSDWVSVYPAEGRTTLVSRFRRTDRRGFLGAFWELYLYELFRRLGFDIELHPTVDGVTRRPDFLLRMGDAAVYLEAVTIYEPQQHAVDESRLAPLLEAINQIDSPRFSISVNARQIANSPLPLDQLTKALTSWLATVDGERAPNPTHTDPDGFKWQGQGWSLFFHAVPRSSDGRNAASDSAAGPRSARKRIGGDARAVRMRLGGKTRYYGQNMGAPFLIALTSYRPSHSPEALLTGLFGPASERQHMIESSADRAASSNRGEGLWLTRRGVRYRGASAVLTAFELMPWSVGRSQPWLIANPWAVHPLEVELPFNYFDVDAPTGRIETVETGFQPHVHFDLPVDWPKGEKFNTRHTDRTTD